MLKTMPRKLIAGLILYGSAFLAIAGVPPHVNWAPCGEGRFCATVPVPRDYAKPKGPQLELAVVKLPAARPEQRIGSLFINFGGPGAPAVETLKRIGKTEFARLNERFDLIGFDPRGVGESRPAIDCQAHEGKQAPFLTPLNIDRHSWMADAKAVATACLRANPGILGYVTTANVARDLDRLRAAVGDERLSYLGFSYGTYLGATYASLFPGRYRAMVLDGALAATTYARHPIATGMAQMSGFEQALDRCLSACAADQVACAGFGGDDPGMAFDWLVAQANRLPVPAHGDNPAPVDGDDLLMATSQALYTKQTWPLLARALATASRGDGTLARELADIAYGRNPDGTYDPMLDRYFAITAVDERWPRQTHVYERAGHEAWSSFRRFWWGVGYSNLQYRYYPVAPRRAYRGPFRATSASPTILVVGTTYDPATPYPDALMLTHELGNARLLMLTGDGHCAYRQGNSACIASAVEDYLISGQVPPEGKRCRQDAAFAQPLPTVQGQAASRTNWENLDFLRVYLRAIR